MTSGSEDFGVVGDKSERDPRMTPAPLYYIAQEWNDIRSDPSLRFFI